MIDPCSLSRTPSSRLLSRPSSFRTTASMEPISPTTNSTRPLRLKSFKRNRASFIHVTAEAMHRQRSLRLHNNPWEYSGGASTNGGMATSSARSSLKRHRRRTVPAGPRSSSHHHHHRARTSFDEIKCVKEMDESRLTEAVEMMPPKSSSEVRVETGHQNSSKEDMMADTVI